MDRQRRSNALASTFTRHNTTGFFLWGYIKSNVFRTPVNVLYDLKTRIRNAISAIPADVLHRTWQELLVNKNSSVSLWSAINRMWLAEFVCAPQFFKTPKGLCGHTLSSKSSFSQGLQGVRSTCSRLRCGLYIHLNRKRGAPWGHAATENEKTDPLVSCDTNAARILRLPFEAKQNVSWNHFEFMFL
jgi:hypothetical protein